MHDLTVEDVRTCYVLAGEAPVLVHNCGSPSCVYTTGHTKANATGTSIHNGPFKDLMEDLAPHGYGGLEVLVTGRGGMAIDGSFTDPATGVKVPVELKPNIYRLIR
jgi:hypothetical protein